MWNTHIPYECVGSIWFGWHTLYLLLLVYYVQNIVFIHRYLPVSLTEYVQVFRSSFTHTCMHTHLVKNVLNDELTSQLSHCKWGRQFIIIMVCVRLNDVRLFPYRWRCNNSHTQSCDLRTCHTMLGQLTSISVDKSSHTLNLYSSMALPPYIMEDDNSCAISASYATSSQSANLSVSCPETSP